MGMTSFKSYPTKRIAFLDFTYFFATHEDLKQISNIRPTYCELVRNQMFPKCSKLV